MIGYRSLIENLAKILLAAAALQGCAAKYEQQLKFNPTEPIRIAVLPFARVDGAGRIAEPPADGAIGELPGLSRDFGESPETLLRNFVVSELESSSLDLVSVALIDSRLAHTGYVKQDLSPDAARIHSTPAEYFCTRLFDCDAVLYGRINRWDQSYYGIESVTGVGYELELVSADDGAVLFKADVEDTDRRGLTGIPTGISSIVIEPILGLDDEITVQLAQRTVKQALAPLRAESRPEFLETPPPAIFAAAHDHPGRALAAGDSLTVLAFGTPELTASFDIEGYAEGIPMTERDPGHYVGTFLPLRGERFDDLPVHVSVTDKFGRTTNQQLIGTVSLTAPGTEARQTTARNVSLRP